MTKLRIALVGAGIMGTKYAEMIVSGYVKNMVLSCVVARKPEAKEWAAGLAHEDGMRPTIYSSVDEMYEHAEDFDAVLVVTPHKSHEEIAVRAFTLGKHVLCDKPAGATIGQAQNMTAAAKKYDRVYGMIFHQHRYPKYMHIKQMLESGELGTIKRMSVIDTRYFRTAWYHRLGSWRSSWNGEGGGMLINQGPHGLDMWQWLFGMPQKLYADVSFGKYNDFMVDDEATIQMRYENGATGVFVISTGEAVSRERLEIVGTKGSLLLEDDTLHIYRYSKDVQEYHDTEAAFSRENLPIEEEVVMFDKVTEPYVEMLENFAEAALLGDNSLLFAPGEDAVNQLMLTNAAYFSAWTGMPVELPLDAKIYEAAFEEMCEKEMKDKNQ